jgi:hypothetical protein
VFRIGEHLGNDSYASTLRYSLAFLLQHTLGLSVYLKRPDGKARTEKVRGLQQPKLRIITASHLNHSILTGCNSMGWGGLAIGILSAVYSDFIPPCSSRKGH